MRQLWHGLLFAVAVAISLGPPGLARADEPIVVVVSSRWAELADISLATLRRIYLGRLTRVEGARVHRYHARAGSAEREAFSRAVLGRSESDMHDYWVEQALSGGFLPPREFRTALELMQLVAARVGALAYVPLSDLKAANRNDLRVLAIYDGSQLRLPDDPQYPIQLRDPAAPPTPH